MLNPEEKKTATELLGLGFSDAAISRQLDCDYQQINSFRKKLDISKEMVFENRHQHWVKLLKDGKTPKDIAQMYGMTERSVRVTLHHKLDNFSFVEIKHSKSNPARV